MSRQRKFTSATIDVINTTEVRSRIIDNMFNDDPNITHDYINEETDTRKTLQSNILYISGVSYYRICDEVLHLD